MCPGQCGTFELFRDHSVHYGDQGTFIVLLVCTCVNPKFRSAPGRVGWPAASAIARMDCAQAAEHQKCDDHEKKHAGQKEPLKVKSPEKSSCSILIRNGMEKTYQYRIMPKTTIIGGKQ